jgi:hypothetical protein
MALKTEKKNIDVVIAEMPFDMNDGMSEAWLVDWL